MSRKWITVWIMALLLLVQTIPASAQEVTPENDANCVSCHEHQYYLYDSGKWFCLCDAPMHCVYCHNGRTDTYNKELAHEGLILYPTRDNAERCQSCHPEDYMARVVTFGEVAGISPTPQVIVTATPVISVAMPLEQPPILPWLRLGQIETWRQVVSSILMIALIGVMVFGYRCWKADCLARNQT